MKIKDLFKIYDMSHIEGYRYGKVINMCIDDDCLIAYQKPHNIPGLSNWMHKEGKKISSIMYKFVFIVKSSIFEGQIYVHREFEEEDCIRVESLKYSESNNFNSNQREFTPEDNFAIVNNDLFDKYMMFKSLEKLKDNQNI